MNPEKLKDLADDLSRVERKHEQVLSRERDVADTLTKLRRFVEAKYEKVSESSCRKRGRIAPTKNNPSL